MLDLTLIKVRLLLPGHPFNAFHLPGAFRLRGAHKHAHRVHIRKIVLPLEKCLPVKQLWMVVFALVVAATARAQSNTTLAEQMGYPAGTKLLIIHADDLAVAHAENRASIDAMTHGVVSSASVMVPCPWLPEVAQYARENKNHDLGLHLTLTSEWNPYKWGPVASRSEVATLVNERVIFIPVAPTSGKRRNQRKWKWNCAPK